MSKETRTAYGETLAKLVVTNKDIIVLDADLSSATKTNLVKKVAPEQHYNCGIAEGNMMGIAAGIAASGKTVFASTFAMFAAGRAFEQIRNSIAYPKLNVKICATHAGLSVGEDGASHQAVEDIALMRSVPNMQVFVPSDQYATAKVIEYVASTKEPTYVRLGRSKVEDIYGLDSSIDLFKPNILHRGSNHKVLLLSTGLMSAMALQVAKKMDLTMADIIGIKPWDALALTQLIHDYDCIVTCEEHSRIGGLYSAICELVCATAPKPVDCVAINDTFGESGKAKDVLNKYGLSETHIEQVVTYMLDQH